MGYRVAELIVEALICHGVDRAFSVPGESFLPLLDALYAKPEFDLVTCRHEGSASLAAVADAKLTGRVGVAMASRGPGAFNASIGLHVASEEAIPLLLLIGQVDTPNVGCGAVQEVDSGRSFAGVIKWSARIDRPDQAAEVMARAFTIATSGTPGPVAIELPEDVLSLAADAFRPRVHGVAKPRATTDSIAAAQALVASARTPIMIVGGECRTDQFRADVLRLSELWNMPVAVTNKNQDQFPNAHPNWIGQLGFFASPAHQSLFRKADLLVAVGTRLGDVSSLGFEFPHQGASPQALIHVYPDGGAIGLRFETRLGLVSSSHAFVTAALAFDQSAAARPAWLDQVADTARRTHGWNAAGVPPADVLGHAIGAIASQADADAVITTDSGNFASWVHRIFKMTPANRLLGSACGAMGSGVPAGLAACLRYPGRQVLAFCGDGGFLMNGNELATAAGRGLDLKIIVSNNRSYGTIRSHQQRHFPARVSGTDLFNPDFAAMARAFGATGFTIRTAEEAPSVVTRALRTRGPVVVEVVSDADQTIDKSIDK